MRKAVMQIDDRMYAKTLEDRYDQVSCFGIAFYKRRCLIQKNDIVIDSKNNRRTYNESIGNRRSRTAWT